MDFLSHNFLPANMRFLVPHDFKSYSQGGIYGRGCFWPILKNWSCMDLFPCLFACKMSWSLFFWQYRNGHHCMLFCWFFLSCKVRNISSSFLTLSSAVRYLPSLSSRLQKKSPSTLMAGCVLRPRSVFSPCKPPCDGPSHSYRNRNPRCWGCSTMTTAGWRSLP